MDLLPCVGGEECDILSQIYFCLFPAGPLWIFPLGGCLLHVAGV